MLLLDDVICFFNIHIVISQYIFINKGENTKHVDLSNETDFKCIITKNFQCYEKLLLFKIHNSEKQINVKTKDYYSYSHLLSKCLFENRLFVNK